MDARPAYFNISADDEGMHHPGPEDNWNESAFFHVVEQDGRTGALFRIGRRVNEGYAEVTALQLREDGAALVGFERAAIDGNQCWRAGGLDFRTDDAAAGWEITYDGELSELTDGELFLEPGRALRESRRLHARFELHARDITPPYRTTTDGSYHGGEAIAKDHYAGVSEVTGTVAFEDRRRAVAGCGFRDHSWGPRNWQGVDCWRWVYGQLDPDNLFSIVVMWHGHKPDTAGILVRDGRATIVTEVAIRCHYSTAPHYWVESVEITIPHQAGPVVATLAPTSRLPLRHRKGEEVLRIVEHLAPAHIDGRPAAGWFETADRMVDGRPFGMTRGI